MICKNCGATNVRGSEKCNYCGNILDDRKGVQRTVPKCTSCGNVGEFKKKPTLCATDIAVSCILTPVFGIGLIYFAVAWNLAKKKGYCAHICPKCGAKDTERFIY